MDFVEHVAKSVLSSHGITVPRGVVVHETTAIELPFDGAAAVKAQVPAGGRGKAGGVLLTDDPVEATRQLLGSDLGGHTVEEVLIEEQVDIAREVYVAISIDGSLGSPLLMFSARGGVDVESDPTGLATMPLAVGTSPNTADVEEFLAGAGCPDPVRGVAELVVKLFDAFSACDAELFEINPVVITGAGDVLAIDAKLSIDDSAASRQPELAARASGVRPTGLEARAAELGLRFIELDGEVGVLANGAGLTMTTMDAVEHYGGSPANFLEIGGDSYTLAEPALEIVLSNPNVRSLIVNFCGAFARCDVMTGGVVEAWKALAPELPVFFSIHGTGMDEAREIVRSELRMEPFESMDDAVVAAVTAAQSAGGGTS